MDFNFPSSHQFFSAAATMLRIIDSNKESKTLTDIAHRLSRDRNVQNHLVEIFSQGYRPGVEPVLEGFLRQISLLLDQVHQFQLTGLLTRSEYSEALFYFFMLPYLQQAAYSLSYFENSGKNTITLHVLIRILTAIVTEPDIPVQIHLNRHLKKILPKGIGTDLKSDANTWSIASEFKAEKIEHSDRLEEIIYELKHKGLGYEEEMRLSYRALQYAGLFIRGFYKSIYKPCGKKFSAHSNIISRCHSEKTNDLASQIVPNIKYVPYDAGHSLSLTYGIYDLISNNNQLELLKNTLPHRFILNDDYLNDIVSNFILTTTIKTYTPLIQASNQYILFFLKCFDVENSDKTSLDEINCLMACCEDHSGNFKTIHDKSQDALRKINTFIYVNYSVKVTKPQDYPAVVRFLLDIARKKALANTLSVLVTGLLNIVQARNSPGHYLPLLKMLPLDYKNNFIFSYVDTVLGLQDNSRNVYTPSDMLKQNNIAIEIPPKHMALTYCIREFNNLMLKHGLSHIPFIDKIELIEVLYTNAKDALALNDKGLRDQTINNSLQEILRDYNSAVFGFIDIDFYDLIFKCEEYLKVFHIHSKIKEWISDIRFRKIILNLISPQRYAIDVALAKLRVPSVYIGPPSITTIRVERQYIP